MARRRRTADQAKLEILDAARELLLTDGPDGLRLELIAKQTGMTHPNILHHFGSMESLREALHRKVSLDLREGLLGVLTSESKDGSDLNTGLRKVFEEISNPEKGRLLAWVVAAGRDPWPASEDYGMSAIADLLGKSLGADEAQRDLVNRVVFMGFMCMVGEGIAGESVRSRFRPDAPIPPPTEFRDWMIGTLSGLLQA